MDEIMENVTMQLMAIPKEDILQTVLKNGRNIGLSA